MSQRPLHASTRRAWLVALAAALLVGCASTPIKPEDVVRERAQARWDALLKGDIERAYGYISPAGRANVPFATYRTRIGGAINWKGATVESVRCETLEKCTANVIVSFTMPVRGSRLGTIDSGVQETWLLDGGQWWYLYEP